MENINAVNLNSPSELSQLRDQLVEQRALQQKAKASSEAAIGSLRSMVSDFTEKYIETLVSLGLDLSFIHNLDYNRLQQDLSYLNETKSKFDTMGYAIQEHLKELLDVQS